MRHQIEKLQNVISRHPGLTVAFSGGADSTLVLKVAHDVHGDEVTALHLHSPLHRTEELEHARATANDIGVRFLDIYLDPLDWPQFVKNPLNRCYLCKQKVYSEFLRLIEEQKLPPLADGTNADDLNDDRPGLRALRELKVITPLAEAGLSKSQVRGMSRFLGCSTWDRPSGSCLATRIRHGMEITRQHLGMIAECENWLETKGFTGVRVRVFDNILLLELRRQQTRSYFLHEIDQYFRQFVQQFGFQKIYLDTDGRE